MSPKNYACFFPEVKCDDGTWRRTFPEDFMAKNRHAYLPFDYWYSHEAYSVGRDLSHSVHAFRTEQSARLYVETLTKFAVSEPRLRLVYETKTTSACDPQSDSTCTCICTRILP
jgi:hypothetical protein